VIADGAPALPSLPERRWRWAAFAAGVAGIWGACLLGAQHLPVDLTAVLLLGLAAVVALALVTGPVLGVVLSLTTVVLVNWYLVPPYGTFQVAAPENVVALVVFPLVAAVTSFLVDAAGRARARAATSTARADLMGDVAADTSGSLERVRRALDLDDVRLVSGRGEDAETVATAGTAKGRDVALDVDGPGGYRLVGTGVPRMAEDPAFLASLAAGAVRAYESGRLDQEVRRAAELRTVDEARSALLASIGHDLRTPLASLRLAVDTLRSPDVALDAESQAGLLATVDASTRRLDELIANLLDMSRLEAGTLLVRPEPVALYEVASASVVGRPRDAVLVHVDEDLPFVTADPVLLERALENLVSNALRHGNAGPGRPVEVRATPRAGAVVVDVVDHGPGLPDGPGRATRPSGATGSADRSAGLGLDIVTAFCRAMDVAVEFRRTEGGGLTVRLTLPLSRGVAP